MKHFMCAGSDSDFFDSEALDLVWLRDCVCGFYICLCLFNVFNNYFFSIDHKNIMAFFDLMILFYM